MMNKLNIYIAGALTGAPQELYDLYEELANEAYAKGHSAYVPHIHAGPSSHPDLLPHQIYEICASKVRSSNMILAYVGRPSFGVGMELEIAASEGIPVIAYLFKDDPPVGLIVLGTPNITLYKFPSQMKDANLSPLITRAYEDLLDLRARIYAHKKDRHYGCV